MSRFPMSFALIVMLAVVLGCKETDNNPASDGSMTVMQSEEWHAVMDNDTLNHGVHYFEKHSNGTVTTRGTWFYADQGNEVQCPFTEGVVTITDSIVVYTAHGTATNPAAPLGFQSSPFTFATTGVAKNGSAYGTYTIGFTTFGWPTQLQGTFTSTKMSGSGITKE